MKDGKLKVLKRQCKQRNAEWKIQDKNQNMEMKMNLNVTWNDEDKERKRKKIEEKKYAYAKDSLTEDEMKFCYVKWIGWRSMHSPRYWNREHKAS